MPRTVQTYATGKRVSLREETHIGEGVIVLNEGQSTIALVPTWDGWGKTIAGTGVVLEDGKRYKITIEVDE